MGRYKYMFPRRKGKSKLEEQPSLDRYSRSLLDGRGGEGEESARERQRFSNETWEKGSSVARGKNFSSRLTSLGKGKVGVSETRCT